METYVFIDEMRLHAYHGVLEQERTVGNDYIISARIGYPFARAMETDDVADTLNYAEVSEIITREMQKPSALLEHVAGRIINALTSSYSEINSINIKVTKIAPPMSIDCHGAGVEIEWEKD